MTRIQFADVGEDPTILEPVVLGFRYREGCKPARIGDHCLLRPGTTIYADVTIGDYFKSGHDVLIRAHTDIGHRVTVAGRTILEGRVSIGHGTRIMSMVYIPTRTVIGDNVFIGPCCCFTNEKYPMRVPGGQLAGVTVENHVSIGGHVTIVAGVRIGEGAFVAAGAIVHRDVPPWTLAVGAPIRILPLPDHLRVPNVPEDMGRHTDAWCPWDGDPAPTWTLADLERFSKP